MQPRWETCNIEQIKVRESKKGGGLFSSPLEIYIYQYQARKVTPSGIEILFKSNEFKSTSGGSYAFSDEREAERRAERDAKKAAYDQTIAYLSNEGWEPAATTEGGHVTLMKRQIIDPDNQAKTDSVSLIQQLANLRDAGILTEQEFQAKKAEILKRV